MQISIVYPKIFKSRSAISNFGGIPVEAHLRRRLWIAFTSSPVCSCIRSDRPYTVRPDSLRIFVMVKLDMLYLLNSRVLYCILTPSAIGLLSDRSGCFSHLNPLALVLLIVLMFNLIWSRSMPWPTEILASPFLTSILSLAIID